MKQLMVDTIEMLGLRTIMPVLVHIKGLHYTGKFGLNMVDLYGIPITLLNKYIQQHLIVQHHNQMQIIGILVEDCGSILKQAHKNHGIMIH